MKFHLKTTTIKDMTHLIKKTSLLLILFVFTLFAVGQDIPPRPQPPQLVNDFADVLNPQQERALEIKLVRFNDTTSNQITIVTVQSLNGYDPAMFAYEIGSRWKVGQKDFNNGIVVLVKPKIGQRDKGQAYIEVGYGLEPAIPDAIAKRIVENEMISSFKRNDYFRGLDDATDVLMQLASGEISADGYSKKSETPAIFSIIPFIIIIIAVILMRSSSRRSVGMGRSNLPFWTALWLGSSMMSGRSRSGGWNGFSGGGSGFGGGGGGFGGFGGGSFGGGGAGGSW